MPEFCVFFRTKEIHVTKPETTINWAPRVSREKILELYIKVAAGNDDEALINEVAGAFYDRCSDIIRIHERRFACPACHTELPYPHKPGIDLICENCSWNMDWKTFYGTIKGRQLSVDVNQTDVPRKFVEELPLCRTLQAKMILIDGIIHACHETIQKGVLYYTRPLAVNFIDGKMNEVVAFLENLPNGPDTIPEMNEQLMEWRSRVLSLFTDSDIEMDKIRYLVESMPQELRSEINAFINQNQRQKAAERLRELAEYAVELKLHRGDIASQVVRVLGKRMKEKRSRKR
jgi:hypothetical protein